MSLSATSARISGCQSDFEIQTLEDIQVDGFGNFTTLRAAADDTDARAKRTELIEAVRAGKHIELAIQTTPFRQQKGKANKRYVRLGGDIASRVKTFVGAPFILDHRTQPSDTRKGSIISAEMVQESPTKILFRMGLSIVKPDAVISVLDGTLDRFSIGWDPVRGAPILCTVHGTNVLEGGCDCWPGDTVTIDGKQKIAEYEFSDWTGKELSGTNFPAVDRTSIDDVRAALAAELSLPPRSRPIKETKTMRMFPKIAAALGLSALESEADEESAVKAIESIRRRGTLAEQELAIKTTALANAEAALAAANVANTKVRVDAILSDAYKAGKLVMARDGVTGDALPSPREARLRRIAAEPNGLASLEAEISEMPVIVPVGQLQSKDVAAPARSVVLGEPTDPVNNPYLAEVAAATGQTVEALQSFARNNLSTGGY